MSTRQTIREFRKSGAHAKTETGLVACVVRTHVGRSLRTGIAYFPPSQAVPGFVVALVPGQRSFQEIVRPLS